VLLTHAGPLHMMTREVIVVLIPESKRQDTTLHHCAGHSVGSEPEAAQVPRGRVPASGHAATASQIDPGASMSQDGR
jgi:hypothetical protein